MTNPIRAYLAWFSISLFFFYQYILRVSLGVMFEELSFTFSLRAEQFASLGAFYLYAYSLIQIPLGLLIDRIGVRRTILGSVSLCMVGTFLQTFAASHQFWLVSVSRIVIGAGSAAAFMGALKVAADYLPPGRRALLMGSTLSLGTIGALTAGKPLVYLLDFQGWRNTLLLTLVVGILVFIMNAILIPKHVRLPSRGQEHKNGPKVFVRQLTGVLKNRAVMLYAVLSVGIYAPLSALADLWGTTFLKQRFFLERGDAAQISMMIYLGLTVGSFALPWLFERYNALNRGIQVCGVMLFSCFLVLLYVPTLSPLTLVLILFIMGVLGGAEMICFSGATLFTNRENSGMTIGVINTLNMLGSAFVQHIIGLVLDFQWSGAYDANGLRFYHTEKFVISLSLLLLVIGVCCLLSLRLNKQERTKVGYSV